MEHETLIKRVTAQALNMAEEDVRVVHRLMGGMSNSTYVVDAREKRVTFRIPGKNAEKFVDRTVEAYHLSLIEPLDINNETVYLDLENGYKIARYINGVPLSERCPYDVLDAAVDVLHRIHESGLKSRYDYNPFGRLSDYETLVNGHGHTHEARYADNKNTLFQYRDLLEAYPKTLCHGDAQISNFIVSERLYLTDWEFSGNHDPFYDIACFGNVDFNHALALLPVYLGRAPSIEDANRLYLWRAFQCLQWHNVALYKSFIGLSDILKIDFPRVSGMYLDKAQAMLRALR